MSNAYVNAITYKLCDGIRLKAGPTKGVVNKNNLKITSNTHHPRAVSSDPYVLMDSHRSRVRVEASVATTGRFNGPVLCRVLGAY